jgi:hypothetical protein
VVGGAGETDWKVKKKLNISFCHNYHTALYNVNKTFVNHKLKYHVK